MSDNAENVILGSDVQPDDAMARLAELVDTATRFGYLDRHTVPLRLDDARTLQAEVEKLRAAAQQFMVAVAMAEPKATRGEGYPLDVGVKMLALRAALSEGGDDE